ncbi:MAG: hypothetical protein LBJ96_05145 [Holosporaceae bacterium]|jgi:hypothetical protein|nr:hypothetical protein [Holosporaceae bacterium]
MKKIIALACALFSAGNIASAMDLAADLRDQSTLINESRFYMRVDKEGNVVEKYTTAEINDFLVAVSDIYRTTNPDEQVSRFKSTFSDFLEILGLETENFDGFWEDEERFAAFTHFNNFLWCTCGLEESARIPMFEYERNIRASLIYGTVSIMDKQGEICSFFPFFSQTREFRECVDGYYEHREQERRGTDLDMDFNLDMVSEGEELTENERIIADETWLEYSINTSPVDLL